MKKTFFRKLILFKITLSWLVVICGSAESANLSDKQLINMARDEGVVFLMRHALAPGMGDPQNFDVNDCETQRLLSEEGRLQARMVGEKLRQSGLKSARVKSRQWCRWKETARLLNLGIVEEIQFLNSFFDTPEREAPQTTALRKWLLHQASSSGLILVTHQVNITALTGVVPSSGELVVIRLKKPFAIEVIGTIDTKY